ncbi:hypothetical protein AB9M10_20180 [Rhodococcus erythropolis]
MPQQRFLRDLRGECSVKMRWIRSTVAVDKAARREQTRNSDQVRLDIHTELEARSVDG